MEPIWDLSRIASTCGAEGLPAPNSKLEAERLQNIESPRCCALYAALLQIKKYDSLLTINSNGHAASTISQLSTIRPRNFRSISGTLDAERASDGDAATFSGDVLAYLQSDEISTFVPSKVLAFPEPLFVGANARLKRTERIERDQDYLESDELAAPCAVAKYVGTLLPCFQAIRCLEGLGDKKRVVAVVPADSLRMQFISAGVETLVKNGFVERVIYPHFATALTSMALIVLSQGNQSVSFTVLDASSVPSFDAEHLDAEQIKKEVAAAMKKRASGSSSLSNIELLSPRTGYPSLAEETVRSILSPGPVPRTLGDAFPSIGMGIPAASLGTTSDRESSAYPVRVISPADLSAGFVTDESARYVAASFNPDKLLQANDVVVPRAGTNLIACAITQETLDTHGRAPMVPTSNVLIIHCNNPLDANYVACFLNSQKGLPSVRISGETAAHISTKALRALPYEEPDKATKQVIAKRYEHARRTAEEAQRALEKAQRGLVASWDIDSEDTL